MPRRKDSPCTRSIERNRLALRGDAVRSGWRARRFTALHREDLARLGRREGARPRAVHQRRAWAKEAVRRGKPAPDGYLAAAAQLGLRRADHTPGTGIGDCRHAPPGAPTPPDCAGAGASGDHPGMGSRLACPAPARHTRTRDHTGSDTPQTPPGGAEWSETAPGAPGAPHFSGRGRRCCRPERGGGRDGDSRARPRRPRSGESRPR